MTDLMKYRFTLDKPTVSAEFRGPDVAEEHMPQRSGGLVAVSWSCVDALKSAPVAKPFRSGPAVQQSVDEALPGHTSLPFARYASYQRRKIPVGVFLINKCNLESLGLVDRIFRLS
jgi:hypothetical protein